MNVRRALPPLLLAITGLGLGCACTSVTPPPPPAPDGDGDGVPDAEDCAPADPEQGGPEICDGKDNDCDGVRDNVVHSGVLPSGEVALEDVAWATLLGEVAWDQAGTYLASPGDVDGDGISDLLIGTYVSTLGAPDPWRLSRTYLVYGPVCGVASLALEPEGVSGAVFLGLGDTSHVGDVNDDGFDDVRIAGSIFFGPVYGEVDWADAEIQLTGWGPYWNGRNPVEFGADLNDDGFGDLIVGDDSSLSTWDAGQDPGGPGRVAIFYGPLAPGVLDLEQPDVLISAGGDGLRGGTGWAVTSPGDLDGDGSDDLVIGSPRSGAPGAPRRGRVDVLYGPLSGPIDLSVEADATITHTQDNMQFGSDLAGVGDIDGDGVPEFAVGTLAVSDALLVFGAAQGLLDESTAEMTFDKSWSYLGPTIIGGRDFDGDGGNELGMSASYSIEGTNNLRTGLRVFGAIGRVDMVPRSASVEAIAGASDFSGDGAPDLIAGQRGWSEQGVAAGAVVVVLGTAPESR